MHILVVNINGLRYTRPLVDCLRAQDTTFVATIVDQASTEDGTAEFLDSLGPPFEVVRNNTHVDLNRLWDLHFETSVDPLLCFLNNDVHVPPNFVADTELIFSLEPAVGCVIHTTNHPDYVVPGPLRYEILEQEVVQGWDFTLRRDAYCKIPDDLKTFGGDDYLFSNLYRNGWRVAVALSSPIVHYYARSRRYYTGSRQAEGEAYRSLGFPKLGRCPYSRRKPL